MNSSESSGRSRRRARTRPLQAASGPADPSAPEYPPRLAWLDYFVLGVAAWSSPMQVWANNPVGVGHPERLILLGAVPFLIAVIVSHVAIQRGFRRTTVVTVAFVSVFTAMRGAFVIRELGQPLGLGVAAFAVVIFGYLISKRTRHQVLSSVLIVVCIALLGGVAGSLFSSVTTLGEDDSVPLGATLDVEMDLTPDMFLVITDGYAGLATLDADFGGGGVDSVVQLSDRGFQIPRSAWSAFTSTETSFPSILDMSYPVGPGKGVSGATQRTLYSKIGGANRTVETLSESGYHVVMVESGWSGSHCGPEVDTCVSSAFMDEAVFWAVSRTVFAPFVLERFGYSFTVGAQKSMTWLLENAGPLSSNGRPDLVIGHLMVPHPPLFLDSSCTHRYSRELSGTRLVRGSDVEEDRRAAYLDQAECVNGFLEDLAGEIGDDAVIVYVADHGTDARDQLVRHPETWNSEDLRERLNVFLAVRSQPDCSVGDPVLLPNLMRRLLSCLSVDAIADLEPRMFKTAGIRFDGERAPMLEVDPTLVFELLDFGVRSAEAGGTGG